MISLILTVHNQQDLIPQVLNGIFCNASALVKEVLIINDGSTDKSEEVIRYYLADYADQIHCETHLLHTPDVFEVKANNVGLRASQEAFCLIVQDDQVPCELGFDARMIKPMLVWPDVVGVTSKTAHNCRVVKEDELNFYKLMGANDNQPRDLFAVRDCVNRGPLLLRHSMLEKMNYLDEIYAPLGYDDLDFCFRAYASGGYVVGSYPIGCMSEEAWGTTRKNPVSTTIRQQSADKNARIFLQRHYQALIGAKHDEDRGLM